MVADQPVQGALRHHIYAATKEVLQILRERDVVDERSLAVQTDEELHIAALAGLTPDHGPEDAHVVRPVPGGGVPKFSGALRKCC